MSNMHYVSPFTSRYASREMEFLFSSDMKFQTWRKLWVALAESEMELGLPITQAQVTQLREHISDIDYEAEAKKEKEIRHDVMAHVYAYGLVCPDAKGIIHLGATSCYVTDNTDVIIYAEGLKLLRKKLLTIIKQLCDFAMRYRSLPTLGLTHLQPAQLVTVGKRATLWAQDLIGDVEDLDYVLSTLKLLGNKGTTGTQASFLDLFDGDTDKVDALEKKICSKMGFAQCFAVSGQTYPRKLDSRIMNVLSGIAQSAYKFSNDIRILQSKHELEEPFEKTQVGSSAMAYKRNPMRSERISSLARYVVADSLNPAITASTQWMERTLDDSANKRVSMSEAFLATDAVLELYLNVSGGLVVYDKVVSKNVQENLPFMATENILMEAVKKGGDRQALHEKIRAYSMEASARVYELGLDNNLMASLRADPAFGLTDEDIAHALDASRYIGRCVEQVENFVKNYAAPYIQDAQAIESQVHV